MVFWWRFPYERNSRLKNHSRSQSHVTTDGQSVSLSWCQNPSGAQNQIFVNIRQLWVRWCGAPSLTSGWVCRLQCLLASPVHSRVRVPWDSWPHVTVPDSRLPQPGGSPRHWVPFSSPPTTRRATVEVFDPQKQGGLVIPPGTGFPFHRLLRLAGLRWRYSIPRSRLA
jgi:hypothetical protein